MLEKIGANVTLYKSSAISLNWNHPPSSQCDGLSTITRYGAQFAKAGPFDTQLYESGGFR
jgi:hypothetical protein